MSENIIADLDLWLASVAAGVCMAFAYDILRLLRRIVRHGRIAVDLEDILYWTLCFFASFVLLYYGNNGVIRFVAVLGAALGMVLYTVSVGKVFVKFSYFLIDKTIFSVFRLIGRLVGRFLTGLRAKSVVIVGKIRKIKRNWLTDCRLCNTIKKNRYFFIARVKERRSAHGKKEKNAKVSEGKK